MPKEYGTVLTGSSQFDLTLPGSALTDRFDRSMGAGHQYHYKRMLPYLKRQGTITIVAFYDYRYFHTANLMVKTE